MINLKRLLYATFYYTRSLNLCKHKICQPKKTKKTRILWKTKRQVYVLFLSLAPALA